MAECVSRAELDRRLEEFKAASKRAGVKLTHQRLEVFREVAASLEHPDAEMVFKALQPRMPTLSLDTVYRALSVLSEIGIVNPLGPRRESVRFDANLATHHHYVCLRCGMTRDFESEALADVEVPAEVRKLGSVQVMQIEVRGLCARCARTSREAREPQTTTTRRRRK